MAEYPRNRVKCSITNSPGLTGDLTVGQALSSYRAFSAADDGRSGTYLFLDGTSWEVRTGCAYTHSTFSLSRGTLEDSNTGSAIALRNTTIVANVSSAGRAVEWSDDTKTALLGLNGIPSPVSGAGISEAQARSSSVQGSVVGELKKLSDGPNKGVRLQWAVPAGATAAAWCWDIYPQAAYQG